MKRIPILITVVALATSLSAEETEVRKTWLVATKAPAEVILDARVNVPEIGRSEDRPTLRSRTVSQFRYINGFAAELTDAEAAELAKSPLVRWVEPNHERRLFSEVAPSTPGAAASSPQQVPYGIEMIGAPRVWSATRGAAVRVGVVDTGIDRNHPDLAGRYRGGRDFVNRDDDPQDDNGHGTHVAGTIAAIDNDLGVVGVAPEADLYGLKVLDASGSGTVLSLIEAVEWAIDNDLDVINMSLGSSESALLEREAFDKAQAAGVIAIAASGNAYAGFDKLDYPANYPTVVAVGAIDAGETIASFSQRGANLDFVAPGIGIQSTVYRTFYGITTSSGVLSAERMEFSPSGSLEGELVDCGLGRPGEFPSNVEGKIALIRRGELTFADKATNAKVAGARGAIIFNHHADAAPEGGVVRGTLGVAGEWILTVGTSNSSGELLRSLTDRHVSLGEITASDYAKFNGTSMATPHVTGAVAILRALSPAASKFQILDALRATAKDLGTPGRDNTFGTGRVDLERAAHHLAPEAFTASDDSRRRSIRRPRNGD